MLLLGGVAAQGSEWCYVGTFSSSQRWCFDGGSQHHHHHPAVAAVAAVGLLEGNGRLAQVAKPKERGVRIRR